MLEKMVLSVSTAYDQMILSQIPIRDDIKQTNRHSSGEAEATGVDLRHQPRDNFLDIHLSG